MGQLDTGNDFILSICHCDLYFMVQCFDLDVGAQLNRSVLILGRVLLSDFEKDLYNL